MVGRALTPVTPSEAGPQRTPRGVAVGVVAAIVLVLGLPLTASAHPYRADLALDPPLGLPGGNVRVTVRLHPADVARHARWFNVTAWQGERNGDGGLVIAPLHEVRPGVYQTDRKVPVFGEWKTLVRLHTGRDLMALPVYMPADPGIPAPMVPPWPNVTRTFQPEKSVLQREAVGGSQDLQRPAYAVLGLLGLAWVGSLAWGLRRLERAGAASSGVEQQRPAPPAPARQPVTTATS
jgi:hypothetical protein